MMELTMAVAVRTMMMVMVMVMVVVAVNETWRATLGSCQRRQKWCGKETWASDPQPQRKVRWAMCCAWACYDDRSISRPPHIKERKRRKNEGDGEKERK
jgi:hypothetical protein